MKSLSGVSGKDHYQPQVLKITRCPCHWSQAFHEVAYKAESRDELLHAINLFLDDSIVLPPGDWDQRTLLPIMDMARKRAHLRRRKKQKEKEGESNVFGDDKTN